MLPVSSDFIFSWFRHGGLAMFCGVSLVSESEGKTRRALSTALGMERFYVDIT